MAKIMAHNSQKDKTWTMGINQFILEDVEEVHRRYLGSQECSATAKMTLENPMPKHSFASTPAAKDWRDLQVITPVKDQGQCGSCYTFSATGALEAHWALVMETSPPLLSEQNIVDCAQKFNNNGCNGGLPSQVFEYVRYNGGIDSENTYPYEGIDNTCRYTEYGNTAYAEGGSNNITAFDENEILQVVGNIGPVSVAFQVASDFHLYKSGVYSSKVCSSKPEDVNHAVLAVGYGTENGVDYWIIKNSWSKYWGMDGYFLMERGKNMCGVADCASWPNILGDKQ